MKCKWDNDWQTMRTNIKTSNSLKYVNKNLVMFLCEFCPEIFPTKYIQKTIVIMSQRFYQFFSKFSMKLILIQRNVSVYDVIMCMMSLCVWCHYVYDVIQCMMSFNVWCHYVYFQTETRISEIIIYTNIQESDTVIFSLYYFHHTIS